MSLTPEIIKSLDDQVMEIAGYLGMEWDQEYADRQDKSWNYNAEIWSGNKRLSFSTSDFAGKTRLVIRAVFPKDQRGQIQTGGYNTRHPEISVAMDRGAEKIAHAIQSRLMPEYEEQLVIALENIKRSDDYHEGRLQTLKAVAEYFGQPIPEDDDKAIYPPGGHEKLGLGIYKIEACSDDQITFTVTCGVPKALKIFEILKEGKNDQ